MPKAIRSLSARPYLLFFAVFVTVTALLVGTTESFSASSLKVISPNGGQSYAVGSSVNIKWAKGNGGAKVKITLLKGGKGYLVISKKTKNDGKLTWKVSSKVKAGSNYKIKIQSLSDTKVSDTSNKPFKITKAKSTKTAALKVKKPNGGKTYKTGQKMAILWVKGNGGAYVKITLLKGKKAYKVVSKKTKNDGKYTYTIPAAIKAGKAYKIKISSTKDAKISDTSDKAFTIAKGTASSTIKVTFPNKGEELTQGTTYVIKWNKGNGGKFVKIQLTRVKAGKDKGFRFIAKKTPNDGKFSWKIPATKKYPVGTTYKIKVTAFKGGAKINDLSDKVFSIVAASSAGSTGGGSTGGGSTGGGNAGGGNAGGGRDGDGQGNDAEDPKDPKPDEPGGGKEGDGQGTDPEDPKDPKPEEPGGGKEGDGGGKGAPCNWADLRTAVLGERYVKQTSYTHTSKFTKEGGFPDGGVATYALPDAEYSDRKMCGVGAATQKLPAHTRTCLDGTWSSPPTLTCPPAVCGDGSVKGKELCDEIDRKCVDGLRAAHAKAWRACTTTSSSCQSACYNITGGSYLDLGMSVREWMKLSTYPAYETCSRGCTNTWVGCINALKYNYKERFDWVNFNETAATAACSRD